MSEDASTRTHAELQQRLLDRIRRWLEMSQIDLSPAVESAFLAMPRHRFVKRYRRPSSTEWHDVTEDNLAEHLPALYGDDALPLADDADGRLVASISQPSLVLSMLDMLALEPGHRVFELGAGSGWNAALMGHIVGAEGRVHSLEIIPELARVATETVTSLGIRNVEIVHGDGGEGYAPGAPFDRAVFTAGAYDLPGHFHAQLKDGGLLLALIKREGGGDALTLLRKTGDHFESIDSRIAGFVPMTGKYAVAHMESVRLADLPEWPALKDRRLPSTRFWWGGHGGPHVSWQTLAIRTFLSIAEPQLRAFRADKPEGRQVHEDFFGLWDPEKRSLVIARDGWLHAYGTTDAKERLLARVHEWVDLGMPGTASYTVQVHPIDALLHVEDDQWLVRREESQFLWCLEGGGANGT